MHKKEKGEQEGKYVSHETIYKMIRGDNANGGTLYKNCRHHLKHRRRPVGDDRIKIPNRTSIHERPKEADGRRFGDLDTHLFCLELKKGFKCFFKI